MHMTELLGVLQENGATDLHLIAGLRPAIRIDGGLKPLEKYEPLSPDTSKELIYSILTDEQRQKFELDGKSKNELDFAYSVPGVGRFRINVHKQRNTVAASIRALANDIPELSSLGLPDSVREFTKAKQGLVLVTGPTGSGKTTTLAALIHEINLTRNDHIITVEDPIEYLHNSKKAYVTQREVGLEGDTLSFKNALKYALRQDPDVILIGEMRDYETIGIAITSAETGHLVFGTLHTSNASQTIDRIVDVFPVEQQPQIRVQLASNLVGVISQVLFPRVDGPGRCLACEVMMANHAVKNNIRAGKTEAIYQAMQTSGAQGMLTMDQSLLRLCKDRKLNPDMAVPYIRGYSQSEFLQMARA